MNQLAIPGTGTGGRRSPSAFAAAVFGLALLAAPMPAFAKAAPESFAPLVERVADAVVNISASQTVDASRTVPMPNVPPGLDEFFNDFFNRRGNGDNAPPRQRKSNSLGSGFVIDSSGIVVTNNHVIADANEITVNFNDGTKLKAELIGRDTKIDLAVLRVKPDKPLVAVKFGDSETAKVGDWVIAIGNPFGFSSSVSAGIVSARNRQIGGQYDSYIQTDAAINKGNSGGPLFNMDGEVIGINTAIISPSGGSVGIGFSVPASLAAPVVQQLREFGETRRGWLGVRIQNVDDEMASALGIGKARGALVAGVDEKGPAKPAGIETGDVIVKFDNQDVKSSNDLPRIVANTPIDKEVEVVIIRTGKEQVKTVKVGKLENDDKQASNTKPDNDGPNVKHSALGLELSNLTDGLRKRYSIKEGDKGVIVPRVDPDSEAARKRLQPGDVITDITVDAVQEQVSTPRDVTDKIEKLKKNGKTSALLSVVALQDSTMRFVIVSFE
jgi:serine protease Do